jgi:hypothetical protein
MEIKLKIYEVPVVNHGRRYLENSRWYCDAVDLAPNRKCLSGHKS